MEGGAGNIAGGVFYCDREAKAHRQRKGVYENRTHYNQSFSGNRVDATFMVNLSGRENEECHAANEHWQSPT